MTEKQRDYFAGAFVCLIGLAVAVMGATYQIGTLYTMGPGFFPCILGIVLMLSGIAIAIAAGVGAASETASDDTTMQHDWRGWLCISAAVVAFIVLAKVAGLLPATFVSVFVSALGDRTMKWWSAALLAAVISVIAIVLFGYFLQVQIPILDGVWL